MIKLLKNRSNNPKSCELMAKSFNLFRWKESPDLVCAVPEDLIVPRFIAGETWEFGGKISGRSNEHPGFDASAASAAARYNGFYLFHAWKPCAPGQPPVA